MAETTANAGGQHAEEAASAAAAAAARAGRPDASSTAGAAADNKEARAHNSCAPTIGSDAKCALRVNVFQFRRISHLSGKKVQ